LPLNTTPYRFSAALGANRRENRVRRPSTSDDRGGCAGFETGRNDGGVPCTEMPFGGVTEGFVFESDESDRLPSDVAVLDFLNDATLRPSPFWGRKTSGI
jgi:hypothetical protein